MISKWSFTVSAFITMLIILPVQAAPPLPGAIFTTTVDGSRVNANLYEYKEDVYLDGGPGPNAPISAAGLPAGDYYFQVTDPSGKDLLSSDHISCRKIRVSSDGVIDFVYSGTNYNWKGGWLPETCQHNQGVDIDHNAVTVQLYPYDDTPNPGGVYKVWITPVADYCMTDSNGDCAADPDNYVPVEHKDAPNGEFWQPANAHGFIPSKSKTDNYKVQKKGKPFISPTISVKKFHDANANGAWDEGEEEITGWAVSVTDTIPVTNIVNTPATVEAAEPGNYIFTEDTPAGSLQTAVSLDGTALAVDATVTVVVDGVSGETHEVIYGNVGVGEILACKYFDRNADGNVDASESGIAGWKMALSYTTNTGDTVTTVKDTSANGCATFANLLPGDYTVTEMIPATGNWQAIGSPTKTATIASTVTGSTVSGTTVTLSFTNICYDVADFDTKGYWHNKNGLSEITGADIAHVNGLAPYSAPSDYFGDCDEPFDGQCAGGPVAAAHGDWGEEIAPAGSALAEISYFLVDSNGDGGQQEQLAQQLLAFIFNTRHRLDDPAAGIQLPDGTALSAQALIDAAIAAWSVTDVSQWTSYSSLLDGFNNNDAVNYVPYNACPVIYTDMAY